MNWITVLGILGWAMFACGITLFGMLILGWYAGDKVGMVITGCLALFIGCALLGYHKAPTPLTIPQRIKR